MNIALDERDVQILFAIVEEETMSTEAINEATGIPRSTVHYRLQSLKESGILKNDLCELDRNLIGLPITVITEAWAEYDEGFHEQVGEKLSDVEGVNQVYFTMGDTDFIVISRLSSRDMVERLVSNFEGIDEIHRTSSKFVITTIKEDVGVGCLRSYDRQTLLGAHELLEEGPADD